MENTGPVRTVTNSEPPSLVDALRASLELVSGRGFECPECFGDPQCPACGEPSRAVVLERFRRAS